MLGFKLGDVVSTRGFGMGKITRLLKKDKMYDFMVTFYNSNPDMKFTKDGIAILTDYKTGSDVIVRLVLAQ